MGMFDDITYEAPCPICGTSLTRWQSKSGGCGLQKLTPAELWEQRVDLTDVPDVNFYVNCEKCATWVEVAIRGGHTSWADGNRRGPLVPTEAQEADK